jgi:hypothetical protein
VDGAAVFEHEKFDRLTGGSGSVVLFCPELSFAAVGIGVSAEKRRKKLSKFSRN